MTFLKSLRISLLALGAFSNLHSQWTWYPVKYSVVFDLKAMNAEDGANNSEVLQSLENIVTVRKNFSEGLKSSHTDENKEVLGKTLGLIFASNVGTAVMPFAALLSVYKTKKFIMPFYSFAKRSAVYGKLAVRDSLFAGVVTTAGVYNAIGYNMGIEAAELRDSHFGETIKNDQKLLDQIKMLRRSDFTENDLQSLREKIGNGEHVLEGGPVKIELSLPKFSF